MPRLRAVRAPAARAPPPRGRPAPPGPAVRAPCAAVHINSHHPATANASSDKTPSGHQRTAAPCSPLELLRELRVAPECHCAGQHLRHVVVYAVLVERYGVLCRQPLADGDVAGPPGGDSNL